MVKIGADLASFGLCIVSQLTDELSKMEEKLKLAESLIESKVLLNTNFPSYLKFILITIMIISFP